LHLLGCILEMCNWNKYSAFSLLHLQSTNSTYHMITPTNFITMSLSTTKKSTMSLAFVPICPASSPNAKQNTIIPGTWVECLKTLAYISDIGANHCQQICGISYLFFNTAIFTFNSLRPSASYSKYLNLSIKTSALLPHSVLTP